MPLSATTNLFIYLIILCIGAAIGAAIERALKGRSTPSPLEAPTNNKLAGEGDVEVLRAWRTRGNKIWLDMDGNRLDNKAGLRPEQYQRLLNLVLDLRPWLETARPTAPVSGTVPQPAQPEAPTPVLAAQPLQVEKKVGLPAVEGLKPAPVLDTIIQQIDKVLQAGLATGPFKNRGIQLLEGPGAIVIVKDGTNKYEGLDAVPDPQVKALIRQAVADWEKGPK